MSITDWAACSFPLTTFGQKTKEEGRERELKAREGDLIGKRNGP